MRQLSFNAAPRQRALFAHGITLDLILLFTTSV
jgi:hypothetical protein